MCPSSALEGNKAESSIANQESCVANQVSRRIRVDPFEREC